MKNLLALSALALLAGAPLMAQQSVALSLGDAARLAAVQAPAATAAIAHADAADARVVTARSELYPSLSATGFDGQHTFNTASFGIDFPTAPGQPPLFDPNGTILGPVRLPDYRISASLTLFDLAARRRVGTARAGATAEHAGADAAADEAATSAANAYIILQRAEALVDARTADSVLASDLLTIARQQLDAGVTIALDVTRAQAQLADARSDIVQARRDRDLARLLLLRRLGLPLDARVELRDSLDVRIPATEPTADSLVAAALSSRTDVIAARATVDAARERVSASRAEYFPTVSVFGDQGVTGKSYSYLLPTYSYGIELKVPLFDGWRRSSHNQESSALLRESQIRQKDAEQRAAADVRGALVVLQSARERVVAARERLTLGERELAESRERFATGVAGNTDVVLAASSLNRARTTLVDALSSFHAARVELARAQGAIRSMP